MTSAVTAMGNGDAACLKDFLHCLPAPVVKVSRREVRLGGQYVYEMVPYSPAVALGDLGGSGGQRFTAHASSHPTWQVQGGTARTTRCIPCPLKPDGGRRSEKRLWLLCV